MKFTSHLLIVALSVISFSCGSKSTGAEEQAIIGRAKDLQREFIFRFEAPDEGEETKFSVQFKPLLKDNDKPVLVNLGEDKKEGEKSYARFLTGQIAEIIPGTQKYTVKIEGRTQENVRLTQELELDFPKVEDFKKEGLTFIYRVQIDGKKLSLKELGEYSGEIVRDSDKALRLADFDIKKDCLKEDAGISFTLDRKVKGTDKAVLVVNQCATTPKDQADAEKMRKEYELTKAQEKIVADIFADLKVSDKKDGECQETSSRKFVSALEYDGSRRIFRDQGDTCFWYDALVTSESFTAVRKELSDFAKVLAKK